jgi:hypothetical protein
MESRELSNDLIPSHSEMSTCYPVVVLGVNDRSIPIFLKKADNGDACSFYRLVFQDAKFCYIVVIKWGGESTVNQVIEAMELSRACTNDLECERYSCHESGKACIFRMFNGLDGEASRSRSCSYSCSTQNERDDIRHSKFLNDIQDTLANANGVHTPTTTYSLEWHVNAVSDTQLHALVHIVHDYTTSRHRHTLVPATVDDMSGISDMRTEYDEDEDDDDDATIPYCMSSSDSDSGTNQRPLPSSNASLPSIGNGLTREVNNTDVLKVKHILHMQQATTMRVVNNRMSATNNNSNGIKFTESWMKNCILLKRKDNEQINDGYKNKVTLKDIRRSCRPIPNNLPHFSDERYKCIGNDKTTTTTSGIRSVGGKNDDLPDALADKKFAVLPVGFNLYTGGDLYPTGTAVVLAVKQTESRELHVPSIQGSNNKRSKFAFVLAEIVRVLYSLTPEGYLYELRGVFAVILPPNHTDYAAGDVQLKHRMNELVLPVDAIIGSVSNFNERQIRFLLPPYATFMKDFHAYQDVTKIDVGMERCVQASLKNDPLAMFYLVFVYLFYTDTGAGLYTAIGRITVHIVTHILHAIQIDDKKRSMQILEDCLLNDVRVTSAVTETDETVSHDWSENKDCVLCQQPLQTTGAEITRIRYITTPNDYNGRAHRSCSNILREAYNFSQNVQCIRRQFRVTAGCTRTGGYCPLSDECPYESSPSSATTKELHLMLVSLVTRYI